MPFLQLESGHINPNAVFLSQALGMAAYCAIYSAIFASAVYSIGQLSMHDIQEIVPTKRDALVVLHIPLIVSSALLLVLFAMLLHIRLKEF